MGSKLRGPDCRQKLFRTLDSVGATPLRDKLVRGDGKEWSKMTREGFVTFARTPAEDFKLCMEIMVQLVSWANGGKV